MPRIRKYQKILNELTDKGWVHTPPIKELRVGQQMFHTKLELTGYVLGGTDCKDRSLLYFPDYTTLGKVSKVRGALCVLNKFLTEVQNAKDKENWNICL